MNDPVTIMLVDDHAVVRAGYQLLLSHISRLSVICEASTGEEACEKYQKLHPDIVVMDMNLPGFGGLEAVRRILARDPEANILMFSIHDEPVYVSRALDAGARGYISKSSEPDVLVEAVVACSTGQAFIDPALRERFARATRQLDKQPVAQLTPREFDIFRLMSQGYSVRDTAQELRIGIKTVANYATTIKEKLGVKSTSELVRLAYEQRLSFPPPPPDSTPVG